MSNTHPAISRVLRSKDQAKSSYNQMSRWYDMISGSSEKKYRDLGLQKLQAQANEQILEIGYGTGHSILSLAKAVGTCGKVYGIDLSEGMHTITERRVCEAGLQNRVDLRVGDATNLPFGGSRFNAVFMSFTLELFDTPEISDVLLECERVLMPGGRMVIVSLVKKAGLAVQIYEWFHNKLPTIVDCRPILAQHSIIEARLKICEVDSYLMWGLPVEVTLCRK